MEPVSSISNLENLWKAGRGRSCEGGREGMLTRVLSHFSLHSGDEMDEEIKLSKGVFSQEALKYRYVFDV